QEDPLIFSTEPRSPSVQRRTMVPPFHPEHPGYSLPDMRPEESLKKSI
ncbi:hypothetical protein ACUXOT_005168, partial [Klebsiella aerogenes]